YPVSGLANNTLYYWRVNATNAGGTSSYSSTWSFTTIVAAPAAPTLASPSNGATGVSTSPTLSWNASTGATSYRLQVSTSSGFSQLVVDQSGITGTSYPVSGLANNTLYYWRVNATNAGGTSSYSTTWSFATRPFLTITNPIVPEGQQLLLPDGARLFKKKLSGSNALFDGNLGLLKFSAMSSNTSVVEVNILADDTLQVRGKIPGGPVSVTVTGTDIDSTSVSYTFSAQVTGVTSVQLSTAIPTEFSLSQNYPNPFNPMTTIEFSIPKQSLIVLTIYNALGIEIEILLNNTLPPGHYRTQWTPRDIPSGVYFYQLRSSEFTETKKLLLLR
ncbi:MAG: T9SS type A sorting domain-containing protein, partial [Candidatus Andersenbacteria bacterium]